MNSIFKRLERISALRFESQSLAGSKMDWNCTGIGETSVAHEVNLLTFSDRFRLDNGRICRDEKQWQLEGNALIFLHNRQQAFERIFTFRMKNGTICAEMPYSCPPDLYSGALEILPDCIILSIQIQGALKNEIVRYIYR